VPLRIVFFLEKSVAFFPRFSCWPNFRVPCWEVFGTWFFTDGFLFPVKELWLLINLIHWVRVFNVIGSYMYIVL
jgi:hypothetical protein